MAHLIIFCLGACGRSYPAYLMARARANGTGYCHQCIGAAVYLKNR